MFNSSSCYVVRCNVLDAEIEFEPLFFDKAVVEECLDLGFIVTGVPTPKNSAGDTEEPRLSLEISEETLLGMQKELDKAAEQKAKDQNSRYMNEVAKCIIEKLVLKVDSDSQKTLTALPAASGASHSA